MNHQGERALPTANRVVVVGAGHGGGSAVAFLRQFGYAGDIVLAGEEPHLPYHRPPLSKAYLTGEAGLASLALRSENFYAQNNVTLRLGSPVSHIDAASREVGFSGGETLAYDHLILAMGAQARKLTVPGHELANIHMLRTVADAEKLKAEVGENRRIAIVGGGYVGLEVAASITALGGTAIVIERETRVLARIASAPLSGFYARLHHEHGVEIITGAEVAGFAGDRSGFVNAVRLADGRSIACDAAVVGVGALSCDLLAREAKLECANGIVVDLDARTSDPAIFAVGDVTWRPMPVYGGRMVRLESVPNAVEQAKQAAAAITGKPRPAPEVPWFWSDQYKIKLQIAGMPFDADQLVVRGSTDGEKFAVFHLAQGRLVCVEAVNSQAEFIGGKQLIGQGAMPDPAKLVDPAVSMKTVV